MIGEHSKRLLLAALMAASGAAMAERYEVVEDRFGSLRAKPVEVAPSEGGPKVVTAPAPALIEQDTAPHSQPKVSQNDAASAELTVPGQGSQPAPAAELTVVSGVQVEQGRELSVFERVYLESEVDQPEVAEQLRKRWQGGDAVDATYVDESQFVDGDALLERRGVSDGKPPFRVTYDSDGRARVTFIDSEKISEALDAKTKQRVFTQATEYQAAVDEERAGFLAGADSRALSILGIEAKSYFQRYAESCCKALPHARIPVLEPGRAHFFKITKDDRPFRFEDGDSRYLLLKLPSSRQNYPLRLRSFIRKFDKQQIEHGVFLPQLVLLNEEKELVRVVAAPLLGFEAENWLKYGYLEGVFEVQQHADARLDERFLVINTTFEDLSRVTQVEVDGEILDIDHMPTGSFEIEVLVDDR